MLHSYLLANQLPARRRPCRVVLHARPRRRPHGQQRVIQHLIPDRPGHRGQRGHVAGQPHGGRPQQAVYPHRKPVRRRIAASGGRQGDHVARRLHAARRDAAQRVRLRPIDGGEAWGHK
ncbi:hypothetical protein RZS08_17610, partial [Arthrospira platensis SPKY1]|nr:hypothetical protein [Arthrospira platensis SPKY1]